MKKFVTSLSKRQKFVLVTLVLFAGIILIRGVSSDIITWRIRVVVFSLVSFAASTLALRDEDYRGIEWVILPILPSFFAISCALIFPLLPLRLDSVLNLNLSVDTSFIMGIFIRLVFLAIFMVGYYAALLTSNIFNVAAVRSIQLLRVAHSIGFLVTVTTVLFFFIVISSFHLSSFANFLAVFMISLPLSFQSIWSVNLDNKIGDQVRNFSLLVALVLAEIAWVLSFWPVGVSVYALFLTAIFYELVGIVQYYLGEKLNARVANEFVVVAIAVFILTIMTTAWGS